jgi:hypothetical protein
VTSVPRRGPFLDQPEEVEANGGGKHVVVVAVVRTLALLEMANEGEARGTRRLADGDEHFGKDRQQHSPVPLDLGEVDAGAIRHVVHGTASSLGVLTLADTAR